MARSAAEAPLHAEAEALPADPGVYLFKDARGEVLYVGKAVNLRARVRQYLRGQDERAMVPFLVQAAAHVEAVVVRTEKEALILENTLIKKHRPRYNVKLVDDSSFLHLQIQPGGFWPRYRLVRHVDRAQGRARHFGPFTSASRGRATLEFLSRRFPLRTCDDRELRARQRPCLMHQMGRCLAPCVGLCTPAEYAEVVDQSLLFLSGRSEDLLRRLRAQMEAQAEALDFEKAARTRDLIKAITSSIERQSAADGDQGSRDAWGLARAADGGVLALLPVRQGMMHEAVLVPFSDQPDEDGALLSTLLNTWYEEGGDIPPEIVLPVDVPDQRALSELLGERRGGAVRVRVPQRGEKVRLIEIAQQNARAALQQRLSTAERHEAALQELQRVCLLPGPPRRMECFDNSNLQGTDPVAAMAVFIDGQPSRAHYRRYRIKTVVGADDFASMAEVLTRRVRRGVAEGDLPDLLVVDGGKGQLNAVLAVLAELGFRDQRSPDDGRPALPVVGIVKPRTERARGDREATDRVVLPHAKDPIRLPPNSPGLRLLQALRDQTHDTAVRYHRQTRQRRTLHSALDELPGVGPVRRKALLEHFGSADAVMAATEAELARAPGIGPAFAKKLWEVLAEQRDAAAPAPDLPVDEDPDSEDIDE
jgi:excinuclease ABC subunit C